jgi:hypothetical protein
LLEGIENSTIWRALQEDQDCSVPPSFDLETRTGQRNEVPEAPSDPQVTHKRSPKFHLVIPLLPMKLSSDELKDKAAYIPFTLQVSKGSAPGTPNYKKSIRTFDKGYPQQWIDVITSLREIWAKNSITVLTDMSNTVVVLFKGDSLTAYEAAMEDNRTDPEGKTLMVPMTIEHIDNSLLAVTNIVFLYCTLKTQKQCMSKSVRKSFNMGVKQFTTLMSRINNYIPYFLNATVLSKYSKEELIGIL